MSGCIQLVGNQGAEQVLKFYLGMAEGLIERSKGELTAVYTTWLRSDRDWLRARGVTADYIACFEDFVAARGLVDIEAEADYLNQTYPDVDWGVAIAVERSFTDYSMLLGGAGHRVEGREYIIRLLGNLARFFEQAYAAHPTLAVVTQTSDTLISYVAIKVAHQRGLPVRSIVPCWLLEPGAEGGFFASDEFLRCRAMHARYAELRSGGLNPKQQRGVNALRDSILNFDGNTAFYKSQNRGRPILLTPHLKHLRTYVKQNLSLDKDAAYTRFSVRRKIQANLIRLWRKHQTRNLMGSLDVSCIPDKSVFFAMHMQPEQSTLAQGIWYVNQIALIENISKALPVGYTLVIKEHPINRGFRPAWQYKHLNQLHNVMVLDAPSKEIVRRVRALITITGTIGVEALVLKKPVVILGKTFYDFVDLLYKPSGIEELPAMLRSILVDRSYPEGEQLEQELNCFLLAYLESLVPHYPQQQNGMLWGQYLIDELQTSGILATRADLPL